MKKKNIITYLHLHLFELKYNFFIILITFFYLFLISYYFSDQLIYLLVHNLLNQNMLKYFIFTNITEIFITNIFIALFIAIFITIQLSFLLIWFFILKGLYKFENFIFIKFYVIFIIFNFIIINFIFKNIIPYLWNFLLDLNFTNFYILTIYFEPKINNYFNFIFTSFIYIFIIFIYFFLLFFFFLNNILSIQLLINLRKFFYLKMIIFSALITPSDILNFILIYFLFILIFEIFIYVLIYINKYNKY
uniref:SecY n=1 Tax=Phytophthora brassicae TaxID=187813 RepID=G4X5F0_PHYBB|nr:SecY [Phytophthora brassicae]AEP40986.1 SecY [Phytophthora brassicae]AEP40987.1 SecY [Phytophthora brassicae]AEP40988.1 SecY [Phytophthora brassicae]AEP40989.1 SecY [Phytophthora brassicae]